MPNKVVLHKYLQHTRQQVWQRRTFAGHRCLMKKADMVHHGQSTGSTVFLGVARDRGLSEDTSDWSLCNGQPEQTCLGPNVVHGMHGRLLFFKQLHLLSVVQVMSDLPPVTQRTKVKLVSRFTLGLQVAEAMKHECFLLTAGHTVSSWTCNKRVDASAQMLRRNRVSAKQAYLVVLIAGQILLEC